MHNHPCRQSIARMKFIAPPGATLAAGSWLRSALPPCRRDGAMHGTRPAWLRPGLLIPKSSQDETGVGRSTNGVHLCLSPFAMAMLTAAVSPPPSSGSLSIAALHAVRQTDQNDGVALQIHVCAMSDTCLAAESMLVVLPLRERP